MRHGRRTSHKSRACAGRTPQACCQHDKVATTAALEPGPWLLCICSHLEDGVATGVGATLAFLVDQVLRKWMPVSAAVTSHMWCAYNLCAYQYINLASIHPLLQKKHEAPEVSLNIHLNASCGLQPTMMKADPEKH